MILLGALHVTQNVECSLHRADVLDEQRLPVAIAEGASSAMGGDVGEDFFEGSALEVGIFEGEIEYHAPHLEHNFLDSKELGGPFDRHDSEKSFAYGWNLSETVDESFFVIVQVFRTGKRVQFAV